MAHWVKYYVDVDEFSQYKDKWARASKWMKEKFGLTHKSVWDYAKDRDQYCFCEVYIEDDGRVNSQGYWCRCQNMSKEWAERSMKNVPLYNIRVYYKADNILYGEIDG